MKKDDLYEEIGNIDDKYLDIADNYKRKNSKTWIGIIASAAAIVLIVGGALFMNRKFDKNNIDVIDNVTSEIETTTDKEVVVAPGLKDMALMIVYNGHVYQDITGEYIYAKDAENIVGEYLGYASGEIDEFNVSNRKWEDFSSNISGEVYSLKDYDVNEKICIKAENGDIMFFTLAENVELKGMITEYGESTYDKKLVVENGKCVFSNALTSALSAYGTDEKYRVVVKFFKDNASAQWSEEMSKCIPDGIITAIETYDDGQKNTVIFTLHAEYEQLKNFDASDAYGYYLMLYDEYVE